MCVAVIGGQRPYAATKLSRTQWSSFYDYWGLLGALDEQVWYTRRGMCCLAGSEGVVTPTPICRCGKDARRDAKHGRGE